MKEQAMDLRKNLNALVSQAIVTESLWELIIEISAAHSSHVRNFGVHQSSSVEDLASEFLLHLSNRAPLELKNIETKNHLSREYKRWITLQDAPANKELWSVLSEALLSLEKERKIERAPEFRKFNNSNHTRWYVKGNHGKTAKLLSEDEVASIKPSIRAKKSGNKVLSPTEAKQWLLRLLQSASGEMLFKDIFDAVKPHLELLKLVPAEVLARDDGDEHSAPGKVVDKLNPEQVTPYLELSIQEEIEFASENIWKRVGELTREIGGHLVLCCYWIPKNVFNKKVKLDQFGPHSSVKNVVEDITAVMKKFMPLKESKCVNDADQIACLRIVNGIIERLSHNCSENGYCPAL